MLSFQRRDRIGRSPRQRSGVRLGPVCRRSAPPVRQFGKSPYLYRGYGWQPPPLEFPLMGAPAQFVQLAKLELAPHGFTALTVAGKRGTSKAATHRGATRNGGHVYGLGAVPRSATGRPIIDSIRSFAAEESATSRAPSTCHLSSNSRPASSIPVTELRSTTRHLPRTMDEAVRHACSNSRTPSPDKSPDNRKRSAAEPS